MQGVICIKYVPARRLPNPKGRSVPHGRGEGCGESSATHRERDVLYAESANGGIFSGSGIGSSIQRGSAEQSRSGSGLCFLAMWEKHDGMRGGRQGVLGGLSP